MENIVSYRPRSSLVQYAHASKVRKGDSGRGFHETLGTEFCQFTKRCDPAPVFYTVTKGILYTTILPFGMDATTERLLMVPA